MVHVKIELLDGAKCSTCKKTFKDNDIIEFYNDIDYCCGDEIIETDYFHKKC